MGVAKYQCGDNDSGGKNAAGGRGAWEWPGTVYFAGRVCQVVGSRGGSLHNVTLDRGSDCVIKGA